MKEPHTAIFSGPTGCGKTQRVLDLIEHEYKNHFDSIVILCPTLRFNQTYLERAWVWKDDDVFCSEPRGNLLKIIEKLTTMLTGEETLFIIDDIIADETLDARRQLLLELAISGRHKKTQSLAFKSVVYGSPEKFASTEKAIVRMVPL